MNTEFQRIVEFRRSNRGFDPKVAVPDEVIKISLERAILSPNSSNMQLWEFYWLSTPETIEPMTPICMNQRAASTAKQMVVFVTRKDKWKSRAQWNLNLIKQNINGKPDKGQEKSLGYYGKIIPFVYANDPFGILTFARKLMSFFMGLRKPFFRLGGAANQRITVHKSCALAAQTFMLSIAAEGFHTCPMEGFDELRLKRYLKLPKGAEINMVVSVGLGTEAGVWGKRNRLAFDEVVFKK
jgi:nitroreductase